mmetsp:Transcript_29313/g.83362  ORF Transcript_29313/g.83362 Transcript_29313/m.83362 type:complete len:251 (-) Transcript_29313:36-788(-)
MGKVKGGPNQKVVAANEKKAAAQSVKDAKAAAAAEAQREAEWGKGANARAQSKSEEAAAKADEAARKKAEKAALLAEEEANLGPSKPKKAPVLSKQGKNKKKDNLSMLEDALVGAADKKVKAKRQADRLKEQKQKEEEAKKREEEVPIDPLLANTNMMIAGTEDDMVGRAANRATMSENQASGIDGALESLNISAGPQNAPSAKALFKAFEERMLPEVKADYPGLKLSQYKEKVFNMWKKSPENPANQAP